jgi:hypothetical protein
LQTGKEEITFCIPLLDAWDSQTVSANAKITIKKQVLILRRILAIARESSPRCSIAMKNRNHCDENSREVHVYLFPLFCQHGGKKFRGYTLVEHILC